METTTNKGQRVIVALAAFIIFFILPAYGYAAPSFGGCRSSVHLAYRSVKNRHQHSSSSSSSSLYTLRSLHPLDATDTATTTTATTKVPSSQPSSVAHKRDGGKEGKDEAEAEHSAGRYVLTERKKYNTFWRHVNAAASTPLLLGTAAARPGGEESSAAYYVETVREVHVVNDDYLLLYIIAEGEKKRVDDGGEDGYNDVREVAPLEIVELAASPSLAELKLSKVLRPPPPASSVRVDSRHFTPLETLPATPVWHIVGVYTAIDEAAHVLALLQTDPRYVRALREDGACYVSLSQASAIEHNVLSLPIAAVHHAGASATTPDEAEAAWTYRQACQAVLQLLIRLPMVRWLEPLPQRATLLNDMASSVLQYSQDNQECEARRNIIRDELKLDGSGEIIAVADTGVDVYSCYFYDPSRRVAYYPHVREDHRKIVSVQACDYVPGMRDATDGVNGHGTHVAGTALGAALVDGISTKATKDAARYNGVAPGAKLFLRDMGLRNSKELSLPNSISDIFGAAYATGARISSNSWGLESKDGYAAIERLVDAYAYAHDDLLLLFAAGNTGDRNLYAPGRAKNVLTVGSHGNACVSRNTVSTVSSYGPTYDGRRKPEVLAPGDPVVSAASIGPGLVQPHCGTTSKKGTSMATGALAGAAALLRQYLRQEEHLTSPSSALLRGALMHSTAHLVPENTDRSGFGRVDLSLLLYRPVHTFQSKVWMADRELLRHRESRTYCFYASAAAAASGGNDTPNELLYLKATLAWTDVGSAMEGSAKSLVHDLDLIVIDGAGKRYYPHATSSTKVFYDRVNTAEQIRTPMTTLLAEGFRVIVYGDDIASSNGQLYSVLVSAPGLVLDATCEKMKRQQDGGSAVFAVCPLNCSEHGHCTAATGICACDKGFTGVDCAVCDAEELCHHNGACAMDGAGAATCTCDSSGHFSDAWCLVCAEGWYGPRCDSTCACHNGGTCDHTTGLCQCAQDRTLGGVGCFSGPSCEFCCEGRGGARCNERSYWCDVTGQPVNVTDPDGGYIQVNGYEQYHYSALCRWLIQAPSASFVVRLTYIWMDIESPYDVLRLYDPLSPVREHKVRSDNGVHHESWNVSSLGPSLELVFTSDWEQVRRGFLIRYAFVPASLGQENCNDLCVYVLEKSLPPSGNGAWRDRATCVQSMHKKDFWCTCAHGYTGFHCQKNNTYIDSTDCFASLANTADTLTKNYLCSVQGGEGAASTSLLATSHTDCAPPVVYPFTLAINGYSVLRVQLPPLTVQQDGQSVRAARVAVVIHLLLPSLQDSPRRPNFTLYVKSFLVDNPHDFLLREGDVSFPLALPAYEQDGRPAAAVPLLLLLDLSGAAVVLGAETAAPDTLLIHLTLLTNFTERTTYDAVVADATVRATVLPRASASTRAVDNEGGHQNDGGPANSPFVTVAALSATDEDEAIAALARQSSSVIWGTLVRNPRRRDIHRTSRRPVGPFTFVLVVCGSVLLGAALGHYTPLLSQLHQRNPYRHVTFYVGREEMRPDEEEMNTIGEEEKPKPKK